MLHGKWSQEGVPHRGWLCVDMHDLGKDRTTCQMCERQTIRYVHVMQHDDYPRHLRCGCVCAGNMEIDYLHARNRENRFRSRITRLKSAIWYRSANGNLTAKTRRVRMTVFQRDGWRGVLHIDGATIWGKQVWKTEEDAKQAIVHAAIKICTKYE